MEITDVKIYPFKKKLYNTIAVCQITFDNVLLITGAELCEKNGNYYIRYPKNPNNKRRLNYYQPKNKTFADYVLDRVLMEYNEYRNIEFDTNAVKEVVDQWDRDYTDAIMTITNNVDPERVLPIENTDTNDEET